MSSQGPLSGIRVIDLTRILAGPWATQFLADLGAEVIKIEQPGGGDFTRSWGPPFITNPDGSQGDAAYFTAANRGKKSIAIDIATREGQQMIKSLVEDADIFVENFKTGGLVKYELDYNRLKQINPGLIYCSITGFGQTGPYAKRAGFDFMIQGMGGIMSITGEKEGTPNTEPQKCGVAFSDIFTGLYAANGIQAALIHKMKTGQGQHLDLALLDSLVAVLANQAQNFLVGGEAPVRMGNAHPNIVPYQVLATKDGHMIVCAGSDRQYQALCETLGCPDLGTDERFNSNQNRVKNRDVLIPILAQHLTKKTTADWIGLFEDKAVPCGPINNIAEVFADPQVQARNLALTTQRADGTLIPTVANPVRMSQTPVQYDQAAPAFAADTDMVLYTLLAKTPQELAALRESKIIE